MSYKINDDWQIQVGFIVTSCNVRAAADFTNSILKDLPSSLYKSLDYKTISSMIGSIFCEALAKEVGALVNPIEKGHPDLVPVSAENASEVQLRNYSSGLEVKCTIGGIESGANLRAGYQRIQRLKSISWQAHHREVDQLLGMVWDFTQEAVSFTFPSITGIFFSDQLVQDDWGAISGTNGRNTKVTGIRASGKKKMGAGWILIHDDERYITKYRKILSRAK